MEEVHNFFLAHDPVVANLMRGTLTFFPNEFIYFMINSKSNATGRLKSSLKTIIAEMIIPQDIRVNTGFM